VVAWSSLALNLALVAGVVVLSLLAFPTGWWSSDLDAPVLLAFAAVGALVASRRRDNRIGWLFCAGATIWASGSVGHQYAQAGLALPTSVWPRTAEAAWAARWLTGLGWGLLATFPLLLFPDGRLPSPSWRPVAWLAAGVRSEERRVGKEGRWRW